MNEVQSSRFKDAVWHPKKDTHVVIGGAGGIGSWLSLLISRAGFFPIVYDYDNIEEHNMGGQLFAKHHIGLSKVEAVKKIVKDFADTDIHDMNERYTADTMSHNYVFSAFDNMQARKDMFEAWCKNVESWQSFNDTIIKGGGTDTDKEIPIFIDGRLTAEQMQIFCVTPDKIEEYKAHLFDDSEVEDAPCTLKQTSHSAAMIASHMTAFFTNHFANVLTESKDRNIPFYWEYFIPINYINERNE